MAPDRQAQGHRKSLRKVTSKDAALPSSLWLYRANRSYGRAAHVLGEAGRKKRAELPSKAGAEPATRGTAQASSAQASLALAAL